VLVSIIEVNLRRARKFDQ